MRNHQNIILYLERPENSWNTQSKIANALLNRLIIDEDFACEIIGFYELSNDEEYNFGVVHNRLDSNFLLESRLLLGVTPREKTESN